MASELRVNKLTNRSGLCTVTYSDTGAVFSGITTGTFSGDITGAVTGAVTATTGSFSGDISIADKIVHTGDTNTALRFPTADTFTVETAGSERLRITSAGKVGINEDVPQSVLHVASTSNYSDIGLSNSTSGHTGSDGANIFLNNNLELALWNRESGPIRFATAGTERLRILSDGKIGIGVAAPTGTLSIAVGTWQSTTPESTGDDIVISGNSSLGMQFLTLASNTSNNNIYFGDTDDVDVGMIRYAHADNSMQFRTNASERFRIDSSGKMGLGTNSPTALLHVSGGSSPAILNKPTDATPALFIGDSNRTSDGQHLAEYRGLWNGTLVSRMVFSAGNDTSNKDNGNIDFYTAAAGTTNLRLRITPGGAVLAGGVTDSVTVSGGALPFQVRGSGGYTGASLIRTSAAGAQLQFAAGSSGNNIADNTGLGYIKFFGYHTNGYDESARIHAEIDGTPGDGDAPGALVFSTTADGASSVSERLRIRPDGEILMGTANTGSADTLYVTGPANSGQSTVKILGNGNNSPQANTCALDVQQNCDGAPNTSPALKLTHTNTLAGTEGAIMSIYTNTNNGTAQTGWVYHTTGRIIHNRPSTDGTLFSFRHNSSSEGNIAISGSTVSYNGGHLSRWSQFVGLSTTSKAARPTIYQGTVLSNLDEMCEWTGEDNQQLNKTKVSDTVGDKDVAGVFWTWDEEDDETGYVNDFYVAMTGDMVIRVAGSTSVARGDLLESAGDGTAKPQSDDIVRSKTIAKIISTTSTATYADGSKAYPCVLMAC